MRVCIYYRGMAPASIINFLTNEDTEQLAARYLPLAVYELYNLTEDEIKVVEGR